MTSLRKDAFELLGQLMKIGRVIYQGFCVRVPSSTLNV